MKKPRHVWIFVICAGLLLLFSLYEARPPEETGIAPSTEQPWTRTRANGPDSAHYPAIPDKALPNRSPKPILVESPVQSTEDKRNVTAEVLQNYTIAAFTASDEINPAIYDTFGFTDAEKERFPSQWKRILNSLTTVEAAVVSDIVEVRGNSSFTVGPIGPTTGPSLMAAVSRTLNESAPKSFVDYVLHYSTEDQNWVFYNNMSGRKRFEIVPGADGGWIMTERAEVPSGENGWSEKGVRTHTFQTVPKRYAKLLDPK